MRAPSETRWRAARRSPKGDDLARASSLRAFVAEECADLSIGQLLPRLHAALATNERPALVLWARYAGKRYDALLEPGAIRRPVDRTTDAESRAFRDVLQQLQAAVADPKATEKRSEAISTIARARAIRLHVNRTRSRLDGSDARALEQLRRQMLARF